MHTSSQHCQFPDKSERFDVPKSWKPRISIFSGNFRKEERNSIILQWKSISLVSLSSALIQTWNKTDKKDLREVLLLVHANLIRDLVELIYHIYRLLNQTVHRRALLRIRGFTLWQAAMIYAYNVASSLFTVKPNTGQVFAHFIRCDKEV